MSHFTVMIIGENPEEQLRPFDESIVVPKYSEGIVTDDDKNHFIDYYTKPRKDASITDEMKRNSKLSFEEMYKKYGEEWNDNNWEKNSKGELHEYSTYNPNSKWDWYQLGGRWGDMLKLNEQAKGKKGDGGLFQKEIVSKDGYADQAQLKDIDIDGMVAEAEEKASEHYDIILKACGGEIPKLQFTWEELLADESMDIGDKRDKYRDQPEIALFREKTKDLVGVFADLSDYQLTKEEYVSNAGNSAISTYAILIDGEWIEKGQMGWWGMSSNDEDQDTWNERQMNLLKEVDPETMISIYDLHI